MKTAKIKNRQKRSMLGVTVILLLLMTLTAGIFTGCGKNAAVARMLMAAQEAAKEDLLNQK